MPSLANELAGLIGPLHGFVSKVALRARDGAPMSSTSRRNAHARPRRDDHFGSGGEPGKNIAALSRRSKARAYAAEEGGSQLRRRQFAAAGAALSALDRVLRDAMLHIAPREEVQAYPAPLEILTLSSSRRLRLESLPCARRRGRGFRSRDGTLAASLRRADQLQAIVPALVQAALQLALMIDRGERPVAEDSQDDDRDQRREVGSASPRAIVVRGRGPLTRSGSTSSRRSCRAPQAPWRRCPSRRGRRRRTCARACRDSDRRRAASSCAP